jgi:hypothetical protein
MVSCQNVDVVAVGSISITSTPSGARIWLAPHLGTYADQVINTNNTISNLAIGSYDVKLVLAGYQDYIATSVSVTNGGTATVTATFAGSLSISSVLSGASIYIDGSGSSSGVTPSIVTGLSAGAHTYQLKLTGYADTAVTGFSITAGQTTTVSNVQFLGSATFTSSPTGARIWIDSVDKGVDTNGTVTGLAAGSRGYTLKKTNYADVSGNLTAANDSTVTVSIITMSAVGSIDVSSSPSGASVYLDGGTSLGITPMMITGVLTGSHDVKLTLATYQDYTATGVSVTIGGTANVSHTMVLSTGSVLFTSTPAGARIWLGPHLGTLADQSVSTPNTISTLVPGSYDYALVLAGYADLTGTITIYAATQTNETVTFAGSLNISSSPTGASVYIDGNGTLSGVTPLVVTGFSPGTHTYRLTKSGYTEIQATNFNITAGQTTTISPTMYTVADIRAQTITVVPSSPCIQGTCSVTVTVVWVNNGQTIGNFVPTLSIDSGATAFTTPFGSTAIAANGGTVTKVFTVTGLTAAGSPHSICPTPN